MCSPLMSYDSVTSDVNRLAKIKNFTMFEKDLSADKLPQWMFITPNMSKCSLRNKTKRNKTTVVREADFE
jgi:hypothetical protein